jgi:hypothetical protein
MVIWLLTQDHMTLEFHSSSIVYEFFFENDKCLMKVHISMYL